MCNQVAGKAHGPMVTPVILPALEALAIDLIRFGVVMTIIMEMGLIHPRSA